MALVPCALLEISERLKLMAVVPETANCTQILTHTLWLQVESLTIVSIFLCWEEWDLVAAVLTNTALLWRKLSAERQGA